MWDEARRLVVSEGWTYAEAAAATGLSKSSVEKRGAEEGWQEEKDVAESFISMMLRTKRLMGKEITRAAELGEDVSQRTFALIQMERAYPEHRYAPQAKGDDPELRKAVMLETIEAFVAYLDRTDRNALTAVQGHLKVFGLEEARRIDGNA